MGLCPADYRRDIFDFPTGLVSNVALPPKP